MSPFKSMEISHPMYTAVLDKLTDTTSILVVATDPQVRECPPSRSVHVLPLTSRRRQNLPRYI